MVHSVRCIVLAIATSTFLLADSPIAQTGGTTCGEFTGLKEHCDYHLIYYKGSRYANFRSFKAFCTALETISKRNDSKDFSVKQSGCTETPDRPLTLNHPLDFSAGLEWKRKHWVDTKPTQPPAKVTPEEPQADAEAAEAARRKAAREELRKASKDYVAEGKQQWDETKKASKKAFGEAKDAWERELAMARARLNALVSRLNEIKRKHADATDMAARLYQEYQSLEFHCPNGNSWANCNHGDLKADFLRERRHLYHEYQEANRDAADLASESDSVADECNSVEKEINKIEQRKPNPFLPPER